MCGGTLLCFAALAASGAAQSLRSKVDDLIREAPSAPSAISNALEAGDGDGAITVWRTRGAGLNSHGTDAPHETFKFQRTTFGANSDGNIGNPDFTYGAELVAFNPTDGCSWPETTIPKFANTSNVQQGTALPDEMTSPHGWVALLSWRGPQAGSCYLADKARRAALAGASAVVRPGGALLKVRGNPPAAPLTRPTDLLFRCTLLPALRADYLGYGRERPDL